LRFTSRSNYLHGNPKAKARHAKLRRLAAKGLLPTRDELLRLAAEATHPVTKCPDGKPVETKRGNRINHRSLDAIR
jgi:hypothetical protein